MRCYSPAPAPRGGARGIATIEAMCGRYAFYKAHPELRHLGRKEIDEHGRKTPPIELPLFEAYNVAPTQDALVLRIGEDGAPRADLLRWGLVPPWAKDLKFGARCINARSEEAAKKPAFRAAWKARRCVVPADGFYEWDSAAKPKRPWYFSHAKGDALGFAGLWESWTDKATGEVVDTFTVLTRAAYPKVRPVHDRSPLILPPDRWDGWLDPARRDPAPVLDGVPDPHLAAWPVSYLVSNARNQGAELIEPVAAK